MMEWLAEVDWEIWGPPLAVLALGVTAGIVAGLMTGRIWQIDQDQADLQARRDSLMAQLRELDGERGKLDEADYQVRKKELVQAAANVLRAMEEGSKAPKPQRGQGAGSAMKHLPWYAAGMVVLFVAAGLVVQKVATPRVEGGSMTGNAQSTPSTGQDPVAEYRARYEADPTDLEAINQLTKFALYTQDLDTAMQLMDAGRAVNPDDPAVQVHLGALNTFIGRLDVAEEAFTLYQHELPAEVAIWRGIVAAQLGQDEVAAEHLRNAVKIAEDPMDKEFAGFLLQDLMMRQASASMAPPTQEGSEDPEQELPAQLTATISAEGPVEPGGVLYLYVRPTPVAAGPPTAAKKLVDWSLPMEGVTLGTGDLLPMAGGVWPEQVYVQAKLARSGDARQPTEGDLASETLGPLAPGASVELVLK